MSSIQGVVPRSAIPKGPISGVIPKKSSVVKQLPPELRETFAQSASIALLQPMIQPFNGIPSPAFMSSDEKKEAAEQQANPLIHPDQTELKKKKKLKASSKQPIISAPVEPPSTKLQLVQRTLDMVTRDRDNVLEDDVLDDLDEIDSLFEKFQKKQQKNIFFY